MKYLVAEIFPEHYRVLFVHYGNSEKKILVERAATFENISGLADFLKNYKTAGYPIIVSLSSALSSTDFICRTFKRRQPDQPIDKTEMENLIAQLIWDNAPADQLLAHNFMIDGHRSADPIGLAGKNIDVYLSRTRFDKEFKKTLEGFFSLDRIFLAGDSSAFLAHLIFQALPLDSFALVPLYYDFGSLIICKNGNINEKQKIGWGEKNLLSTLFGNLALSQEMARKVLRVYCQQRMSAGFYRKLHGFFSGEIAKLSEHIKKIANDESVNRIFFAPFFLFPPQWLKLNGLKTVIVDNNFISHQFGFELELKEKMEAVDSLFLASALLTEMSAIPMESAANKIIRRRLRWSIKA